MSQETQENALFEISETRRRIARFYERLMVVVFVATLAATCWLISAGPGVEAGHIPWRPGSILRAVTGLMALDFQYPTLRGVEVKWLVQGLGAAFALMAGTAGWFLASRQAEIAEQNLAATSDRMTPATLAQGALLLFAGWTILSGLWAPWPAAALGEGLRQLTLAVWAIALGRTLSRRAVGQAAASMAVVLAMTAGIGIWYFFERNPYQRLKFPIGNPIFMATCLLPGITLVIGGILGTMSQWWTGPEIGAGASPEPARWNRADWAKAAAAVVGLFALCWALKLTDSRGPQIGLIVGLAVAVCAWVQGRRRRFLLWAIAAVVVGVIVYVAVHGWPGFVARRMDTVMLRGFAWVYALRLFGASPWLGQGQASYVLRSQEMANADAQNFPLVFPGQLMGHAHNEWIEILADLGLIGLLLILVVLGATCWAGIRMMSAARSAGQRGVGFGLLAGFVGIVVAEASGVALRMPGTPVLFYSLMGLIWAGSRRTVPWMSTPLRSGRIHRGLGVLGMAILAYGIMDVAIKDWRGALADRASARFAASRQWDQALAQAGQAAQGRLTVEGRLAGLYQYTQVAFEAATHRWTQMEGMLARVEKPDQPNANIVKLAREDSAVFDAYAQSGLGSGIRMLQLIPGYPDIAGQMAELLLLKQKVEVARQKLGLVQQVANYLPAAREWMAAEYQRQPSNARAALRLFQFCGDRPVRERLDLLRSALRSGPTLLEDPAGQPSLRFDLFDELESALVALVKEDGYRQAMDELAQQARAALQAGGPAQQPDAYVTESLRLVARDRKLMRHFDEASEWAGLAVEAAGKIADRWPGIVSCALVDQARYRLLAHPEEPAQAAAVCREAINRWPDRGADVQLGRQIRSALGYYLLAVGDEEGARQWLGSIKGFAGRDLDQVIGLGLAELCRSVATAYPVQQRPEWLGQRLQRALELMPDLPELRWYAAFLAFESGDSHAGLEQIRAAEVLVDDPDRVAGALESLARSFPQDTILQEFIKSKEGAPASSTSPAGPVPETLPAPERLESR